MKTLNEVNYMLDPNIDERIKNICQQAENNYILNYSKSNTINNKFQSSNNNYKTYQKEFIENKNNKINELSLDKTITKSTNSEENLNILENPQKNIFINYNRKEESQQLILNQDNKQNLIENGSLFLQNKNEFNSKNNNNKFSNRNKSWNKFNTNKNNIIKSIDKSYKNNTINLNKEMIDSINNKVMFKSNNIISPHSFKNENNIDENLVNYNSQLLLYESHLNHNHNPNSNYNSFLSSTPSFCFECDLQKLITDKNIYNKDLNIKTKENKEINNIILSGKILLQKNKLQKAYNKLSAAVKIGIIHPDLFYLYGEVCRKLKFMEDAQKYLLICLDYKNCSPYVYLSLAQLYKEIGQIKYSKNFYKKCLLYFNKPSIYYNLGINYIKLNKPLKAINCFTEAIKLEPNQPLFYKYRAEIYKSLGHNELYLKDLYNYNIYSNK